MKIVYFILCVGLVKTAFPQEITAKLGKAITLLQQDKQFEHSILSMYVVDSKTGSVIYAKNEQIGLAPASCQKIITSASAFEMLGSDYRYKTNIGYFMEQGKDVTGIFFVCYGDPTLGSPRYTSTKETVFMNRLKQGLLSAGISKIDDCIQITDSIFSSPLIPRGWIWEDIGNYFGAGAAHINWRENQYTIILNPGNKEGDTTTIKETIPDYTNYSFNNKCTTGPLKSGDNTNIYFALNDQEADIYGTIPLGENNFAINGAIRNPGRFFFSAVDDFLRKNKLLKERWSSGTENETRNTFMYTYLSPSLDSINYWFLKKSINLYGEAFVKTIAYEKTKVGSTDTGVNVIRNFWSEKGIEKSAIKIIDGSGLSPANRVTTDALVKILQYAKLRPWFFSFYNALPEMNGIKMKDGYIGGVRSYTGYVRSATGAEYSFSFIVNNFDGNPATAREKMWKILDLLK